MKVTETKLKGCFIIEPRVFEDKRGYFYESFNTADFLKHTDQKVDFVQDNESCSTRGVLRGLHYQRGEYGQAKLVRVLHGKVLDVLVDIREGSSTYGQHFSIELSSENKKQLFVPRGFAHGFIVLSESATFFYKCDNYYNKEFEGGIIYNDKTLQIDWKLDESEFIISDKDLTLPIFENCLL
jgi:dTDP-4-dehydrorhamnose 3,5-epimerase|tara:strand:+ start:1187 stop:1732 length:546 start_codon:yes stop_codon:yes gene_type:complete